MVIYIGVTNATLACIMGTSRYSDSRLGRRTERADLKEEEAPEDGAHTYSLRLSNISGLLTKLIAPCAPLIKLPMRRALCNREIK